MRADGGDLLAEGGLARLVERVGALSLLELRQESKAVDDGHLRQVEPQGLGDPSALLLGRALGGDRCATARPRGPTAAWPVAYSAIC